MVTLAAVAVRLTDGQFAVLSCELFVIGLILFLILATKGAR